MYINYFCHENLANTNWDAALALFIATLSLVTTIWLSWKTINLTKEHNKKSVEPFLTGQYLNMAEETNPDLRFLSYSIKNCGPGPAILTSLLYNYEGETFTKIGPFIMKKMSTIGTGQVWHYDLGDSHILASNDTIQFFKVSCTNEDHLKKLMVIIEKIGIKIKYESIYGIKKPFERESIFKD